MKIFTLMAMFMSFQWSCYQSYAEPPAQLRLVCQHDNGEKNYNRVVVIEQTDSSVDATTLTDIDTGFETPKVGFRVSIFDKAFVSNDVNLSEDNFSQLLEKEPSQVFEGSAYRVFNEFLFEHNGIKKVEFDVDFREMQVASLSVDDLPYALHCLEPMVFTKASIDETQFADDSEQTQQTSQW